jgi:DNA-binding transcriptional LysR family regulator
VTLRLVTGDSREIVERVRNADVEAGIVGAPPSVEDLQSTEVGRDRLILILPPAHPLAGKSAVGAPDLARQPFVMREEGSGTREATESALRKLLGADAMKSLHIACEVGSAEAVKAAVRSGLGAAFVSDLAVHEDLAYGTLATAKVRGFDVTRSFHFVSRPDDLLGPAARAFKGIALGSP